MWLPSSKAFWEGITVSIPQKASQSPRRWALCPSELDKAAYMLYKWSLEIAESQVFAMLFFKHVQLQSNYQVNACISFFQGGFVGRHTHPLGWRSSSLRTVWSQYSKTRWSFRLRRNTSIRFTRLECFSCCTDRKQKSQTDITSRICCTEEWLVSLCLYLKHTKLLREGNKHAVAPDNLSYLRAPDVQQASSAPTHCMTN